jgi:hypothetical protein
MQIELSTHGVHDASRLRPVIESRLRLVLGRFAHRVRRLCVSLVDVNGPRGGVDCELRIEARLDGAADVQVLQRALNPREALGLAGDRIRRAVRRSLSRAAQGRRPGPPAEVA